MRPALVGLIAIMGLAPAALAQTPTTTAAAPAAVAAPAPTPMTTPAPAPMAAPAPAPTATPAPMSAPAAAPDTTAPTTAAPPAAAPAPPPPAPEAPPAPPAPPTDPTAIALLNALQQVCIPAANGGDLAKIAKAAGYRKSGDNFVLKQPGFQFTVLAQGSNPTQCHVDILHPIDPETPAKPLVIALNDWAVTSRGWTLYQNNKNVTQGQEFTTRSWEHTADGKYEAVVLSTVRKADGTPSKKDADTTSMIYSVSKAAS